MWLRVILCISPNNAIKLYKLSFDYHFIQLSHNSIIILLSLYELPNNFIFRNILFIDFDIKSQYVYARSL